MTLRVLGGLGRGKQLDNLLDLLYTVRVQEGNEGRIEKLHWQSGSLHAAGLLRQDTTGPPHIHQDLTSGGGPISVVFGGPKLTQIRLFACNFGAGAPDSAVFST